MMDRQPSPQTSTPTMAFHPCPDERYNWPAERGAGQIGDYENCRKTCVLHGTK